MAATAADVRCPDCGERPRFVMMYAAVKCALNADGSVGKTVHVGPRHDSVPVRYACGGGHTFPGVDPLPQKEN